jgi:O-antigen ligase
MISNSRKKSETFVVVTLALLIFIVPFFDGSASILGGAVSQTMVMLFLLAGLLLLTKMESFPLEFSYLHLLSGFFLLAISVAASFAAYPARAWNSVGVSLLLLFFFFAASLFNKEKLLQTVLISLLVAILFQALIGIHQALDIDFYRQFLPQFAQSNLEPNLRGGELRIVGGFINPNYFAALINVGIAITIAIALFFKSWNWQRIAAVVAAPILLVALLLSGSKGGLITLAAVLCLLAILKDRRILWGLLIVLLLLVAIPNPLKDQMQHAITADPFVAMRPDIWAGSLQMFADHSILGVGPAQYAQYSHLYAPTTDFLLVHHSIVQIIAHNSFLHALAEYGLLGMIPLLIMAAGFAAILWRQLREKNSYLTGLAVALISILIHSMVDNVLNNRALLIIAITMLAVLISSDGKSWLLKTRGSLRHGSLKKSFFAVIGLAIFVLFFLYQILLPYRFQTSLRNINQTASTAMAELDSEEVKTQGMLHLLQVRQEARELVESNAGRVGGWRTLASIEKKLFITTGRIEHLAAAESGYRAANQVVGGNSRYDHYNLLALQFDLIQKGYPKTEEMVERLQQMADAAVDSWPTRAAYYQTAATVYRSIGEAEMAIGLLLEAVELEPNYLAALQDLSNLATEAGDALLQARVSNMVKTALERRKKGVPPDQTDLYGWQIIAIPQVR